MTNQAPKRPRSHVLEDLSEQHVRRILPPEWICSRVAPDYGLDLRVEIVAGEQVTGREFSIQLKATDHLHTSGDHILHRCDVPATRAIPVFCRFQAIQARPRVRFLALVPRTTFQSYCQFHFTQGNWCVM